MRGDSLGKNVGVVTADAIASTVGNMVVDRVANTSTSTLHGPVGNVDDLVRKAAQAYGSDAGTQFAQQANWNLSLQAGLQEHAFVSGLQDQFGQLANDALAASRTQDQALKQQLASEFAGSANWALAGQRAQHAAAADLMAQRAITLPQGLDDGWSAADIEAAHGIMSQKGGPVTGGAGYSSPTFTPLPLQDRPPSTEVRGGFDQFGKSTAGRAQYNLGEQVSSFSPNYSVSLGAYLGVGGEVEMTFHGVVPNEVRFGVGLGVGAHGQIKSAGSSAQGFPFDGIDFGTKQGAGDFRIGSSIGGNIMFGPIAIQPGIGGGKYSNIVSMPSTGSYGYAKLGAAISPSVGIGADAKLNIIEFDYKWR